jgi:AraC-like DNA-binding protein
MPRPLKSTADAHQRSLFFSTETLPPASRLEAWNAAFGTLNAISVLSDGVTQPGVRCENWLLGGGLVLSETSVTKARFTRDAQRSRRDQLDHWVLRVLRRGRGVLRHPGFEVVTGPGDLVLFSMHETWVVDWDDVAWVSLCIPRDLDLRLSTALASQPPGLLRGAAVGLLADLLLALPARVAIAQPDEIASIAGAVHAAIGACLPVVGPDQARALGPETTAGLAKERVRRAILRNIGSVRLKPAQLAAAAGLSRSALYRLFEPEGGVARYVRHVRLGLAHSALTDPASAHLSIGAIAEAHGFPEPAEFSRAFRSVFGATPSDVRNAVRTTPIVPLPIGHPLRPASPARNFAARVYGEAGST